MTPEVEAAIDRLTGCWKDGIMFHRYDLDALISAYREAERDAARYRWLRLNCRVTDDGGAGVPEHAMLAYRYGLTESGKKLGRMAWFQMGLDACIDAAIAKGGSHAG